MTYNYFNEMHGIWLKVSKAIPKNVVAVPGRVGMAECSLDLIFFLLETDHLFFLVGGGGGG